MSETPERNGQSRTVSVPNVSVVICTYNRADMLGDALQSWQQVDKSGLNVELLVVDNASTDATRSVVESVVENGTSIVRYVYQGNPGLSRARNRGMAEARGAIVAFVDDDVFFEQDWLLEIDGAFRQHPDVDCVGGKSLPRFEVPRPDWLEDSMLAMYGCTKSGNDEGLMVYPVHPFGVNMAFRRTALDRVGEFGTDLGRKGNSLLSNEEKDYFYRVNQLGMRVLYVPSAVLHHRVPASRLRKDWLKERTYWQGISNVCFDQRVSALSKLALSKRLVRQGFKYLRSPPSGSFKSELRRSRLLGEVRQSFLEILGRSNEGSR